ncbi:hypothetical protein CEUSTIGMA_g2250.t1 [Chlamydomonas eustigma]|uniref:Fe2OG dioxygenase domain-containing protein n=1 Tax=Chlamydomonas eustigma TaxID=1157962 RepID=A0A250WVD2_9CHLO|nr:hypothetical protein CEUSTIGMA_g2250.t1 [Chlamydomonas eustigma]|eukprot:GAX74803.1 hypothetical protein CEUSTIGMA_g2250.t1 [Chlamydomonas eustigma]
MIQNFSLFNPSQTAHPVIRKFCCSSRQVLVRSLSDSENSLRLGYSYTVTERDKQHFRENGYVHLKGVLSEEEMDSLEEIYNGFLNKQLVDPSKLGKDFCDMSGDYNRPLSEFNIINIMLPSKYYPPLKGNLYEQRSASIAEQLCGEDMVMDYDQLLAKPPLKPEAVFHWHQDLAYWPVTSDTRTASFWLAVDDSNEENGCIRFVPGSHREPQLRPHLPLHGDREKSHTLVSKLRPSDQFVPAVLKRGDVTVHHERVVHGSGGNTTKTSWRRAYVIAYRSQSTVDEERRMGFTHSHNDAVEVLNEVGKEKLNS